MGWYFHASDPMGGAAGEAFANTLKSPGMLPEHVLAREAIQNSVDAGNGAKVEVRFRSAVVAGAKKTAFVQAADLGQLAARAKELALSEPNCLSTLDKPQKELRLLYVEDYNAVGLSGEPHDMDSNFYRLLLSLGDRSKSRTAQGNTGGSYGFGKSVYSSSSAIQTIFAYTRFKNADGKEQTRIFGCGYFVSHTFQKSPYSGRAWLGTPARKDDLGRIVVDPLEGKKADELAGKLGFTTRDAGELGTSILIVDAAVDIKAIERGVEDWWWPRLVEHKLDVKIIDPNGDEHIPRPKKNPGLRPFIEAYDIALGRGVLLKQGQQKQAIFNKEQGLEMGRCGFVVAPVDPSGNTTVQPDRVNSVALIRGPLMVVAYHPVSQANPAVVGAYVAPDEDIIEQLLRKSEPPAHDRWDPDSTNLRDGEHKGSGIVQSILNRIKQNLRKFQTEAAPATPAKQRRMTQLERALGAYFKPSGGTNNPPPDSNPSPLHLEFSKAPYAEETDGGMLRLKSTFTVRLDDSWEEDSVPLRLQLNCPVLEDNNEEGDNLPITVAVDGVEAKSDEASPWC